MREAVEILGVPMHAWTMEETVDEIARRLSAGVFTQHVVVNAAKVVNMRRDPTLDEAVRSSDIINIDGMGVVWAGRVLGAEVPERVAGVDLFQALITWAAAEGEPVYLLGCRPEVIEVAARNLQRAHPDLVLAGWHHGYFWQDEAAVVRRIAESGAKLLFVAITSPRKETFIEQWSEQLGVTFVMGVGGTLDIVAGKTKRAPRWIQRSGLEWLYRTAQEPRRLWRRYLDTNSRFAWMVLREVARRGRV